MPEVRVAHLGPAMSAAVADLWTLMRARDWTQGDVARALGMKHNGLVNCWLHGKKKPGRANAVRVSRTLGIAATRWDEPAPEGFGLTEEARELAPPATGTDD